MVYEYSAGLIWFLSGYRFLYMKNAAKCRHTSVACSMSIYDARCDACRLIDGRSAIYHILSKEEAFETLTRKVKSELAASRLDAVFVLCSLPGYPFSLLGLGLTCHSCHHAPSC